MTVLTPIAMLGTGPGPLELLLVFAAVLILFGPDKLPKFARTLGRIMEQLRSVSSEFRSQIMRLDTDIEGQVKSHIDSAIGTEDTDSDQATTEAEPSAADGEESTEDAD